ncbi:VOC family protein [Microlunatus antarcticus]|uniref:Catechol 2,3-dioxygenase-like lactoylglutathione lyase family enzyme n=1 Tax=Microlunatus antarcticus TaxID=53388 RepID=A0A7W5JW59_9ACTN|nr:catechol 2,3-dioxygenase-like lactoylglutathione lyase family enzyme [Microlunatus antarcticus]
MRIDQLDHLVLTVVDLERTVRFYVDVLGMEAVVFEDDHVALHFGDSKINLHQAGNEYEPKAARPGPGTGDLCFTTSDPLDVVQAELAAHGVAVLEGPGPQTGARGPLRSVYIRDPDGNLVEISNELG